MLGPTGSSNNSVFSNLNFTGSYTDATNISANVEFISCSFNTNAINSINVTNPNANLYFNTMTIQTTGQAVNFDGTILRVETSEINGSVSSTINSGQAVFRNLKSTNSWILNNCGVASFGGQYSMITGPVFNVLSSASFYTQFDTYLVLNGNVLEGAGVINTSSPAFLASSAISTSVTPIPQTGLLTTTATTIQGNVYPQLVGSGGSYIVASSTGVLSFAMANVVQVTNTNLSGVTGAVTTFTSMPLLISATITPSYLTSMIQISASTNINTNTGPNGMNFTLFRNGTVNLGGTGGLIHLGEYYVGPVIMNYIDSPNTTLPVTYTIGLNPLDNPSTIVFVNPNLNTQTMILTEIN